MELTCIKEYENYIVGKSYKLIGRSGGYVEIVNELGETDIMLDIYFSKK